MRARFPPVASGGGQPLIGPACLHLSVMTDEHGAFDASQLRDGGQARRVGDMTGPAAQGVRIEWAQIPAAVRAAIEEVCGAAVVQARTQPGGFSPGLAARVRCANGARYFVKAVSAHANPDTPGLHRQEARVLAALEPLIASRQLPIPRLHGTVDRPPWIALVLQDIAGRQPKLPWQTAELQQVVAALDRLADALTPAPVPVPAVGERLGAEFTGWRTLAASPGRDHLDPWSRTHLDQLADLEATWAKHAAGDTLLHADIRADNILLTSTGAMVVDWPWACRGAAFIDLVLFAPSAAMQGGPPPADLITSSRSGRAASPHAVTALVCALAGYLTETSLRPPPPGLPTIRAFQAAQATITRHWLTERL
jgi:aminoglycoside phosphotransferase (APT) family kinase protein